MKPSYEELLKGSTRWSERYKDVTILINFHGHSEDREGTWCYYLIIPQEMYPHRWKDFKCYKRRGYEQPGDAFDGVDFHGGITWSSNESYWDSSRKQVRHSAKVGCDYAHLWDMEAGYPDYYESVLMDAKETVDQFLEKNPDRLFKSRWSHLWGKREDFYEARNGALVHKEDKIPEDYDGWKPKETREL